VGIDAAKFSIEANEKPAIASFKRMEKAYNSTLKRISGDSSKSFGKMQTSITRTATVATKSAKKMEGSFSKAFKMAVFGAQSATVAIGVDLFRAIGRTIAQMFELSSTFETGLAGVSTIVESDVVPTMARFEQALLDISFTGDQTLGTLTTALRETVSAGFTAPARAIEIVKEADIAATAGLTTTANAITGLTSVLNAWGKEAGTVQHVNDVLFKTVQLGVTTFPNLSKAIGTVAGIAAQAGVSLEETTSAFATLTKTGLNTRKSMTFLKNVVVGLIKPSKGARDAFKEFGIEIGTAAIKQKGLLGIMKQISVATGGNVDEMARLFPNIRSLSGASILAGKGLKNFTSILDATKNAAGRSRVAYDRMAKTWKFQTDTIKNRVAIFMQEFAGPIFGAVKEALVGMNKFFKENRDEIEVWGKVIGTVIGVVLKSFMGLLAIVGHVAKFLIRISPFGLMATGAARAAKKTREAKKATALLAEQTKKSRAPVKEFWDTVKVGADASLKSITAVSEGLKALITEQKGAGAASLAKNLRHLTTLSDAINTFNMKKDAGATRAELETQRISVIHARNMARLTGDNMKWLLAASAAGIKKIRAKMDKESAVANARRVSEAKTTTRKLIAASITPHQKARALLEKRLKALRGVGTRDVKNVLKARKIARALYYKSISSMAKKSRDDLKKGEGLGGTRDAAQLGGAFGPDEKQGKAGKDALIQQSLAFQKAFEKRQALQAKAQSARRKALAEFSTAGAQRGTFLDVMFGSDEQIQKRFGSLMTTLGLSVASFRSHISEMFSPNLLTQAAVWWGKMTATGKRGADQFVGTVKQTMMVFLNTMANSWQAMWKGIVTGQDEAKQPILATLLDMVSQMASIWGGFLLTLAAAYAAQFNFPGAAIAVAAAAAMFALAGISAGGASLARGNTSAAKSAAKGGGPRGSAIGGAAGAVGGPASTGGPRQTVINMGFTFPPTPQQAEQIGQAMAAGGAAMPGQGLAFPQASVARGVVLG